MEKTPIPLVQAREEAARARERLLDTLKEDGFPLEVGANDGEGRRFTKKRIRKIKKRLDRAYLQALEERYTLV